MRALSAVLLAAAVSSGCGFRAGPSCIRSQHVLRPHQRGDVVRLLSQRKGGLIGVVDDILDFVSDLGGYNGFTEGELKGEEGDLDVERLAERDMSSFGAPTEGLNDNVTSAFVVLLIIFPLAVLAIGINVFGVPSIFTFAT
jgi:hypothetical protein